MSNCTELTIMEPTIAEVARAFRFENGRRVTTQRS
jgi:hypothetical protein